MLVTSTTSSSASVEPAEPAAAPSKPESEPLHSALSESTEPAVKPPAGTEPKTPRPVNSWLSSINQPPAPATAFQSSRLKNISVSDRGKAIRQLFNWSERPAEPPVESSAEPSSVTDTKTEFMSPDPEPPHSESCSESHVSYNSLYDAEPRYQSRRQSRMADNSSLSRPAGGQQPPQHQDDRPLTKANLSKLRDILDQVVQSQKTTQLNVNNLRHCVRNFETSQNQHCQKILQLQQHSTVGSTGSPSLSGSAGPPGQPSSATITFN